MNTPPVTKKEIKLNDSVVNSFKEGSEEIQKIQEQIKPGQEQIKFINNGLSKLVIGIALQDGFDVKNEGLYISEDFTTVYIFDLPKDESTTELKVVPKKETFKKK